MKKFLTLFAAIVAQYGLGGSARAETDGQIRQTLIQESIASYPGRCPCPYNVDRAGRSCGGRSAYSRKGGYAPLCYARDVTREMVEEYKRKAKPRTKAASAGQ